MYELEKIGKVFTSKFVGTGPSSCKKRIYRAAVSQRLTNTALHYIQRSVFPMEENCSLCGTNWIFVLVYNTA